MDTDTEQPLSIETVRQFARRRTEELSIRVVARETGLDKSTIHKFIHGSTPHARGQRVLREWYSRVMSESDATAHEANAAVAVLVARLPPTYARIGRSVVFGALAGVYRAAGMEAPPWTGER